MTLSVHWERCSLCAMTCDMTKKSVHWGKCSLNFKGSSGGEIFFEIKLFSSQCSQPAVTCDNCPSVQFTRACDT